MGSCLMVDIYVQRGRTYSANDNQDIEPLVYIRPLLRSRIRRYNPLAIVDIYKDENNKTNKNRGSHMHGIPNRRFQ